MSRCAQPRQLIQNQLNRRFALGGDRALTKEAKQLAVDLRSAAEKASVLQPVDTIRVISFCPAQGDVDAAKQAIWSGADVNQIDREGKTPLIHAARFVCLAAGDTAWCYKTFQK